VEVVCDCRVCRYTNVCAGASASSLDQAEPVTVDNFKYSTDNTYEVREW